MSLIVPQITAWVSLSAHPVQGPECQLAAVSSEDGSFHSLLSSLGILPMASFLSSQPHHTGQPPSSGANECGSKQKPVRGKRLYHRGEHLRNRECQ